MRAREREAVQHVVDESLHDAFADDRIEDENELLRAALARISHMRRDSFATSFEYEVAVRRAADRALGREA